MPLPLSHYRPPLTPPPPLPANDTVSCPLNFIVLTSLSGGARPSFFDSTGSMRCQFINQPLRLVQSDYLLRTGFFVPPLNSSESCWKAFQSYINIFDPTFDVRSSCGFQTNWISQGCINVTTKQQFEALVPQSAIQNMQANCNQSLGNNSLIDLNLDVIAFESNGKMSSRLGAAFAASNRISFSKEVFVTVANYYLFGSCHTCCFS